MSNIMKTKFHPSLFDIWEMRREANQIARDAGFTDNKQIDAFRHAYVSAKMQETYDSHISEGYGRMNEHSNSNNPGADQKMDMHNNKKGQAIEREISQLGLATEEREQALRERIRDAVLSGELQVKEIEGDKLPASEKGFERVLLDTYHTTSSVVSHKLGKQLEVEFTNGEVIVKGYSRSTGEVKGHTRTRPDGDLGNNKSFKFRK